MVAVNRQSKMLAFINYRVRVTIVDGRHIVGRFLAFDRHMNLVLADAEEFRRLKSVTKKRSKKSDDDNDEDEKNGGEDVRRVLGCTPPRRRSGLARGRPARSGEENQTPAADGAAAGGGSLWAPASRDRRARRADAGNDAVVRRGSYCRTTPTGGGPRG